MASKRIEELLAREAEAFERERKEPAKKPVGRPRLPEGEVSQVYSVRIPVDRIEELRRRAVDEQIPPSALIRSWVLERLGDAQSDRVVDLMAPLEKRARSTAAAVARRSSTRAGGSSRRRGKVAAARKPSRKRAAKRTR